MSRLTINSNIASLNAQRMFGQATSSLSQTFNRLSSGLRINKASDDAAGLSVASILQADRRVIDQGIRNVNDGISYLNIAESALNELTNVVTRIGELAEQSANGTLGSSQREALQKEVTSLQSEYNRIIKTTKFNGEQLLTGLNTNVVLQGGYGVGGQLGVQIGERSLGIANDLERAGLTKRVDTASDGTIGNNGSRPDGISADGRYVLLMSGATNLIPGGTSGQAYIKDVATGVIKIVSTDTAGNQANAQILYGRISADGRYVAFETNATNMVSGDTNGTTDVFLKDTITGITTRISTDSMGNQGNAASTIGDISADGRYITFHSDATNLVQGDTNGSGDVFIKDILTGQTTRISTDSSGIQGNNISFSSTLSADGRFVSFGSISTNLVAGDANGQMDMFLKDRITGETKIISLDSSGNQGNGHSNFGRISADGRYVAFNSYSSNLVAGDTNGAMDLFLRDLIAGTTTRVSTDSFGNQANSEAYIGGISADGRYITFTTYASNLVAGDTNGRQDTYLKDMSTGVTSRVSLDDNGNQTSDDAGGSSISADGRSIVYQHFFSGVKLRDVSKTGINEISGMVVSNQASAKITLDLSKKYLNEISTYKGGIGASLSRATTFVNTLQVQSENYSAASSQITDADVALESAALVRTQILQQSAAAVLGQANLQPNLVLQLLRNV